MSSNHYFFHRLIDPENKDYIFKHSINPSLPADAIPALVKHMWQSISTNKDINLP